MSGALLQELTAGTKPNYFAGDRAAEGEWRPARGNQANTGCVYRHVDVIRTSAFK